MPRFVVLSALVSSGAFAQTTSEFQLWNATMATVHLSKDTPSLAFWLDVQARKTSDGVVHITRPGVGVQLTPWLSLWAGYAWTPTFIDGNPDVAHEHRFWQQVLLQYETSFRLNLQSRTRFEQRWNEAGADVGFRFRQFVRVSWRPSADVPVGALVSDELFVGFNATSWGAPGGVDQNRLFIGPFFQLAPWARIEAGYLLVYLDRANDRLFHAASVLAVFSPKF